MSNPVDGGIHPGSINKHPQHPYLYLQPQLPQHDTHQQHEHQQHHNQHQQHQQHQYLINDAHHPQSNFDLISSSAFNLDIPSYAAVPSSDLLTQAPQTQDPSPTGAAVLSHKLTWDSEPGTSSGQQGLVETAQGLTDGDMRYIKGPLDVLSAEQYDDGRYTDKRRLSKPATHVFATATVTSNPKKRARKAPQNEQAEPVEEIKRARGRPRLETGDQQDMKERRKEQIRLAQRAYRNRKETTITDLEAKVAGLEASNAEVKASFQSLLMEFVENNPITTQFPEFGRRVRQFEAVLTQHFSGAVNVESDKETTDVRPRASGSLESGPSQLGNQPAGDQPTSSSLEQQSQQLLGGLIVTHEPESQSTSQDFTQSIGPALESDEAYTFVRMPHPENASFGFGLGFWDSTPTQTQWSLAQWEALPLLASGAYLERTLGRKLHRRTTERAAKLLSMENPPYDMMHRVFGFVRNYASLENIRERVATTLNRSANEDLNAYAQPFHQIGGSGTHFTDDARTIAFPPGAPFQNAGFGMGPFNEKTTAVRDGLLDILQRSKFPGWQGEWFDSYDVEQYLAQKLINLPQEGDGYVEIPPGDFYDNPLDDRSSSVKGNPQKSMSRAATSDFNIAPDIAGQMPMHPTDPTIAENVPYSQPVSSINSVLPIPAVTDMWSSASMSPNFLAISQAMPGDMSSLLAYHNPTSLGFTDSSNLGYPSSMNLVTGQTRSKRVWFSLDKFLDSLGSKGTCIGRGPAFRKDDIVVAFWEAVQPEPE
ncbi:hypothetical protein F5Y14DRAFT_439916 [Nemania sp. NC0429]|nr:hypothetical protein F5Y14DRAFT_439916 [Nemania sp. NC0429]